MAAFTNQHLTRTYISACILFAMFEWDKPKDKQNQLKHGISFADTFAVFDE